MAITRTDLQNMIRAMSSGRGQEAGEALASAAREFGAGNLAAKRLREQIEMNRQGMALRERLADLEEKKFNETLPLEKERLQAEIDKTKNYISYLNDTLSMREKELGMQEKQMDYNLSSENRAFTQSLFGLGYGTPEEREAYLKQQSGGAFTVGPDGTPLGQTGTGTTTGGSFLGAGTVSGYGSGYSNPMSAFPLGGQRVTSGGWQPTGVGGTANTSRTLSSSGTRGRLTPIMVR